MTGGKLVFGAVLLLGGAFFIPAGCAAVLPSNGTEGNGLRHETVIPGVPFLPQEEETCGPSSLAMNLKFLGTEVSASEIVRETRTEGLKGTLITDLAAAARKRGFDAEITDLDLVRLKKNITEGVPVILLVDLGVWAWSRPHYLLAYGWTSEGVIANSGRERGKVIPFDVLDKQWRKMRRSALVVRNRDVPENIKTGTFLKTPTG